MKKFIQLFLFTALLLNFSLSAQENSKVNHDVIITNATVVKLGHSEPVRNLKRRSGTSDEKREQNRKFKKVPDNFKGRNGMSKSTHTAIEHQGPDPVRQSETSYMLTVVEPIVNVNGIGDSGSPHDPSGDVSDSLYVQMINGTDVGVFNLLGGMIETFDANTLWSEFSQSSSGDPIVLYDENVGRWLLTEFADPANVLIAISDNGDPLGAYTAYSFSTPNFPDYPKYGLSPEILTFTSNEEGGSNLHNYFIDLQALYAGDDEVSMQRIEVMGNGATEAGFYVTTPVDWNGTTQPFDSRPLVLNINDSSWPGGPAEDEIDIYTFEINFNNPDSSQVLQTSVITTPFDPYPCSESGQGFACIPQKNGSGLDGVPEVIMNIPHLRNFGTHESMVFSFITDATNGENRAGIRWMEMRRTSADSGWELYQEGTFAPDDSLDRFMPSIAIDGKGNIGLAYNVSSSETFVGARFTGRKANDPLGVMTVEEYEIVEGRSAINSGERFGDYSQMSVSPLGDNTFWWTSEYAGSGNEVTQTRIVAFKITQDTFDLAVRSIDNPVTSSTLTSTEQVSATIINSGIEPMSDYKLDLFLRGVLMDSQSFTDTLQSGEVRQVNFVTTLDLEEIDLYEIEVAVSNLLDQNMLNDTLSVSVRQLNALDAAVNGRLQQGNCTTRTASSITISNNGAIPIDSVSISVTVNEDLKDTISYLGSISYLQSVIIDYELLDLPEGKNTVVFKIISINGTLEDGVLSNNEIELTTVNLPSNHFITLEFRTDDYPAESSWELTLQDSEEIIASGDYTEIASLVTETICVNPDSCYVFTLNDAENDGICCGFGMGNFNIYDNEGLLLVANDGNFGASTTENFCATAIVCTIEVSLSTVDASAEGVGDGVIFVDANSGVAPYLYSVDGGETFQDSATFTGLTPGVYEVLVKDDTGACEQTETAMINFPSGVFDFNKHSIEFKITPNPTSGVFKLMINNLSIAESRISVQILNISGQIIQERKIGKYGDTYVGTFSLMDYPAGTYLLRINHKDFNYMDKVIRMQN